MTVIQTKNILKRAWPVFFVSILMVVAVVVASFMPKKEVLSNDELGIKTIVIDAGHGGKDPGNLGTGRYKTTEKHIALNVALKLGGYINENFPDVKVIYTRDNDEFIELRERTDIANKAGADLFISIHCNSAANHSAYGTETFVMGLEKSEANMRTALEELAKKENSSILLEENYKEKYNGFDPKNTEAEIFIYQALLQQQHLANSLSLASRVQTQYRDRVGRRDRGVRQNVFWVISYTTMPSILTELGFLTHTQEEDFLNSEDGQVFMASALYRAFKEYKAEVEGVKIELETVEREDKKEEVADPNVEQGLWFKIQIESSKKELEITPKNFKGLEDVSYYVDDKQKFKYRYVYGKSASYEDAKAILKQVRKDAYPDAFIVAFQDGQRISISDAVENQSKKKRSKNRD